MNLIIIIIISLFISCIWLYYLRLIDVFENEKLIYIVITFVLGSIIPNIIYPLHTYVFEPLGIENTNEIFGSFIYYTFAVGLPEEIIKAIPVFIILFYIKKAINEPLDYIIYAAVSALGFAFGENVEYASVYGHEVLLVRSILSVPAHIFFSGLFVYGYVLYKFNKQSLNTIFIFAGLGVLSHGIYDFLLGFDDRLFGNLLNLLFFFLLINAYSTILNNGLNNSPFFNPQKTVNQEKVRQKITMLYVFALCAIFAYYFYLKGATKGAQALTWFLIFESFILGIIIVRLSRFSIIPGRWQQVKVEFPFSLHNKDSDSNDYHIFFGFLKIKGESYNDWHISRLFGEEIHIIPLNTAKSSLKKTHKGIIEQKLFMLQKPVFVLKVFLTNNTHKHFILIAKTSGTTHASDNSPIASLNSLNSNDNKSLVFLEWVVLRKEL